MGQPRPILTYPDPVLRQVAAPVAEVTDDIRALAEDMIATMYAAPGRGLAAPQVGVLSRIFVMDADWKDGAPRRPQVFINPEIVALGDTPRAGAEGCLSIPGIAAEIIRPGSVTLAWSDLDGARQQGGFTGFAGACVQHEYDHLDGKLWMDRASDEVLEEAREALAALAARA